MSAISDHPGVSTLTGTPKEVRASLGESHADRVLVVAFDHIKPKVFEALAENFTNLAFSISDVLNEFPEQESLVLRLFDVLMPRTLPSLTRPLVEVQMPRTPPSPARLLKEAAMVVRARNAVLESGDWLTAAELAQLAGLSTRNPSAQPNKWKKKGLIFAISHGGADYFPSYGLDRDNSFRPVKALAKIIETFGEHKDGWGLAYWFRSDNSFLGGKRPQDLLASAPERVIEAAMDEVLEIAHG